MDNDHGITGELREWAQSDALRAGMSLRAARDHALAIADRIDAEHEKALDEWKAEHGQMWLKGYGECHAELMEGNEVIAASLEEAGWVKLPVDAEGKPWHVGDMTEHMQTVQGMCLNSRGWYFSGTVNDIDPSIHRHYRKPTVEDVLREFADKWTDVQPYREPEIIAEYAARLRLADDGKEQ